MSGRRIGPLTLDALADIGPSAGCVKWELDPVAANQVDGALAEFEKERWLSAVLLDWGSCGRVAYLDDQPVGHISYAPAPFVPRSFAFPTSPISPDAVALITVRIARDHRGEGLARMLVQAAAKDLTRRGVRAIEAFGAEDGLAARIIPQLSDQSCLVPADFLRAVGFATVRAHPRVPRLRLDLRTTLSWREDVEAALEKILSSVRVPALHSARDHVGPVRSG